MGIRKRADILRKHEHPVRYASGYTMDLYCQYANPDHGEAYMETFYGENFNDVKMDAIRAGWSVDTKKRFGTCKKCLILLEKQRKL